MIDIIFEDNHLFVVNKPAGMLTQPSGTDRISIEDMAKSWLKENYKKEGNVYLHAIHRLDRPVSGIVVFAKTSKALSRLQAAMRQKEPAKYYFALVEGKPAADRGDIEHYLIHDDFMARVVTAKDVHAKLAKLSYEVIEHRKSEVSLLKIKLETGRYHQIRAQLSAIGLPILGDSKYGSRKSLPQGIIALHHGEMHLHHPTKEEVVILKAELPAHFNDCGLTGPWGH